VNPSDRHRRAAPHGFSLVELMVAMILIGALLAIGLGVFGKTAASARRTASDQFTATIEQARTAAITRRKPVILAIAAPVPGGADNNYRIGLFEVDELPERGAAIAARQLQRWNILPTGVVFFSGAVEGFDNPLDEDEVELSWKDGENQARVRILAFNPRGGLSLPPGSEPVAVTLGSGVLRDGQTIPTSDGGRNSLRIGRVIARPWRLDG
jgi:prepilin-type N-terminal cleavage/methylation domain-containing protein